MRKGLRTQTEASAASKNMQTEYSTAISLAQLNGLHRFLRLRHCHFRHANQRPLRFEYDHHSNRFVAVWKSEEEANLEVSPLTDFTGPHWGANHIREHRELAHFRSRGLIVNWSVMEESAVC